ncbi:MAG: sigma-70 family RNA polymerase sigma factor [bacterium]|nr:sigma-70 family RNA polymerase sigma factor [candidate division KSB1 bacterium]MDH7560968.1 sigma-70 family RNA polymerase sigma factor [bacterium]
MHDELISRVAAGDAQAFTEFYQRYAGVVLNLCFRLVRDREDANDLTQEVFVRVFRQASSFRHQAQPLTWLYRIATNLCLNHLRRAKRHDPRGAISELEEASAAQGAHNSERPDVLVERREAQALVWRAIESLPPAQRAALVLQKYEGLSCQEIAAVMGCSVASVHSRLHRAKENLARALVAALREE